MITDYSPDVPFLSDELATLAKLNYRHFVENPQMALEVARAMTDGRVRWTRESVDKWVDVASMVKNRNWRVDCEEIAAITAAFFLCCFGVAKVGIRQITPEGLCHCISSDGTDIYDPCLLLGMTGSSSGPAEWRELKETPMGHAFAEALKGILSPLWKASKEAPSTAGTGNDDDVDYSPSTGASWSDTLAGYLVPGSLISKVERLERDAKDWKKKYDGMLAQKSEQFKLREAAEKQRDENAARITALQSQFQKEKLAYQQVAERSLNEIRAQRDAALQGKNTCEATLRTKEQMLASANAYLTACRAEVSKIETRQPAAAPEIKTVFGDFAAQYNDDALAEIIAEKWATDNDAMANDMMTLGTLAEHAKSLACCTACAHDKPCDAKTCRGPNCPITGDSHHDSDDSPESSERTPVAPFFGTGRCLPCQR